MGPLKLGNHKTTKLKDIYRSLKFPMVAKSVLSILLLIHNKYRRPGLEEQKWQRHYIPKDELLHEQAPPKCSIIVISTSLSHHCLESFDSGVEGVAFGQLILVQKHMIVCRYNESEEG